MPVVEDMDRWGREFEAGWLAYVKEHVIGVPGADPNWDLHKEVRNRNTPSGRGVDLLNHGSYWRHPPVAH